MNSFLQHILSLNQSQTKYGKAPHKPILLLSVIESFENGEVFGNRVKITENLLERFHDIWNMLVKTQNVPNFALPFYHLKNGKGNFWNLETFAGKDIPTTKSKSIKSFKALTETVAAAELSAEFYYYLSDPLEREKLKAAILEKYFGKAGYNQEKDYIRYSEKIKMEILYEPEENYVRKVQKQIFQLPKENREEFVFLRSTQFRKAILDVYDRQCSVTGLKVEDVNNNSLVDACHIVPFAETYNDSIRNGLALSPTFHLAFDRGFIAISDDYRILVHPKLRDYHPETGIQSYQNKAMKLPADARFYPSQKSLSKHRRNFGFS